MPSAGLLLWLLALAAALAGPAAAALADDSSEEAEDSDEVTRTTTSGTTVTTTSSTRTTVTSTSTTTTTPSHVYGGEATKDAYKSWLAEWRKLYRYGSPCGVVACLVPELPDSQLPAALQRIRPQVVISAGGVAGGVVTEGMGYGIMLEGIEAARGSHEALDNGLSLIRSWLGMVRGPFWGSPLAGGFPGKPASATEVHTPPYGVSAVSAGPGKAYAGLPAWKWPLDQCENNCNGTATDGDQDAVLGMIYIAAALNYPSDFVDMVMRSIIAFASADLGFPDLYRILPGGEKIFVPKMGSTWGGLLPKSGVFKTNQQPWCYGPGYFAPAHYRFFRDFLESHWRPAHYAYLPKRLDGLSTTLSDLTEALESATTAGYNILYRASCNSGSVANWVGVEAECKDDPSALHCEGVPWKHTPYVGPDKGTCNTSQTQFGQYGADASRTPWRIAMDYAMYKKESNDVKMYDRDGKLDETLVFGSHAYLNRIVGQYKWHSQCDGGLPGACLTADSNPPYSPWKLAFAFDFEKAPPDLTCESVPKRADTWWAGYMAYPTFTAFVAPYSVLTPEESICWMDTFASICNFQTGKPSGAICSTTYFDLSQEVVASMVLADRLLPLESVPTQASAGGPIAMDSLDDASKAPLAQPSWPLGIPGIPATALAAGTTLAMLAGLARALPLRHGRPSYRQLVSPLPAAAA